MSKPEEMRNRILDAALQLAEAGSWEQVRLQGIADHAKVSLSDIHQLYTQKDDLVEAWFDRADQAMLAAADRIASMETPESERLHRVIVSWFDALQPYRRVTRQMLGYKLEFGHIHLQVLGVLRISRTVQWFREAARLRASGPERIAQEVAITSVFLLCFGRWLFAQSPDSESSSRLLAKLLRRVPALEGSPSATGPGRHPGRGSPRRDSG